MLLLVTFSFISVPTLTKVPVIGVDFAGTLGALPDAADDVIGNVFASGIESLPRMVARRIQVRFAGVGVVVKTAADDAGVLPVVPRSAWNTADTAETSRFHISGTATTVPRAC